VGGRSLRLLDSAVEKGIKLQPDIICLTGDYITRHIVLKKAYTKILSKLTSSGVPVFAVLGNHDGGRWAYRHWGEKTTDAVKKLLADAGIAVIENRTVVMKIR
jgi:predicted MPP superfamily phosphohydrolase